MSWLSDAAQSGIGLLSRFANKSATVAVINGTTLTAGTVESGLGTLHGFLGAFVEAVKAKNYEAVTELSIDEALSIAGDLGVPYASLASALLPLLWPLINKEIASFGHLVSDGKGGFVTEAWASDPRHALTPDGKFKY
jgi:hypothetical protein